MSTAVLGPATRPKWLRAALSIIFVSCGMVASVEAVGRDGAVVEVGAVARVTAESAVLPEVSEGELVALVADDCAFEDELVDDCFEPEPQPTIDSATAADKATVRTAEKIFPIFFI